MSTQGRASPGSTLSTLASIVAIGGAAAAWWTSPFPWLPISMGASAIAIGGAFWSSTQLRKLSEENERHIDRADSAEIENGRLQRQLKRHGELEKQLLFAKQAAESATMAKGEFLATMSHEIRTPLNGIIPMLEMIAQGPLEAQQREMLQAARSSSMQLFRIVDDILDYSKLEANRLELEVTSFNLREVLDSMQQLLQHSAQRKQLQVGLYVDPGVRLAVRGDPVRLRQILSNLIVNAIKFTEHGSVQLHVRRQGETDQHHLVRFEVRDTGIGISEEQQQRLFNSFSQADASTTRLYGGTGLGLAICKRIVDLMNGKIGVESQLRQGSTFWFEIPLLKVAGDIHRGPALPPPSQVMLISPDIRLRRQLELQLNPHNIAVHVAENATVALERLRAVQSSGSQIPLSMVFADLDALGDSAPALHRAITRSHGGMRLIWIHDQALVPEEVLDRAELLPRQFQAPELQALLQPQSDTIKTIRDTLSPPTAATPSLASVDVSLIGAQVLLVEDNPVNQMVAQKLLGVLGCQVRTVGNGELALEEMAKGDVDVVLMDCQMPVLDGYTATRRWREREFETGGVRLPIIAMTANAMAGDRQRCLDAGMDDYLSKPVSREELRACLQRWYQSRSATAVAASRPATGTQVEPAVEPPTSTPASNLSVLDQEALAELQEVVGSEIMQIIQVFLDDAPHTVRQLQEAATNGDLRQLQELAHNLKSASANVGASALSAAARRVEVGARAGTLDHPAVAVALVIAEFARARIALTAYQANTTATTALD